MLIEGEWSSHIGIKVGINVYIRDSTPIELRIFKRSLTRNVVEEMLGENVWSLVLSIAMNEERNEDVVVVLLVDIWVCKSSIVLRRMRMSIFWRRKVDV
mmetsp:Transcript_19193/g.23772  ORF Transcript_19193/g.23772 Transcript_19193/m.23772 type:complete len:99 (+) Transcript_19193:85-381(+)